MTTIDLQIRANLALRVTREGLVVNIVLFLVKLAAGIVGHSQAMLADAVHTLSDFVSDIAVLLGIRYSSKPVDTDHAYGHGQYETLTAAFVGLLLFGVGLKIGWEAVRSLIAALDGTLPEPPERLAFWAAILSVVAKEAIFRRTLAVGKLTQNDALVANAWHHRSDAFSSVASALGIGAAVFLGKEWSVMDPVAALFTSFLLLRVSLGIIREKVGGLTERALPCEQLEEIRNLVLSYPEFSEPHNLRTRMVGPVPVIDLHVRVAPDMSVQEAHRLASLLEKDLQRRFGEETITNIHIEPLSKPPSVETAP